MSTLSLQCDRKSPFLPENIMHPDVLVPILAAEAYNGQLFILKSKDFVAINEVIVQLQQHIE